MRKLTALAALAVTAIAASVGFIQLTADTASGATVREIYLSAVEWKGSATVAKEPFPTQALPGGGGYEKFAPGHAELAGDTTKWAVETYRFDTAVVAACAGERIALNIFGVNAALHKITIPDFGKKFDVKRGMLSRQVLTTKKAGIYPIICLTHQPSHRADLVVFPCG